MDWRAYGPCDTDADCGGDRVCDTTPRCDPDRHRVDPQGRTLAAILAPPWYAAPSLYPACASVLAVLLALGALLARKRRAKP